MWRAPIVIVYIIYPLIIIVCVAPTRESSSVWVIYRQSPTAFGCGRHTEKDMKDKGFFNGP
ncbi:MAG: hypothetical protein ABIC40_08630, partial [bacterium]